MSDEDRARPSVEVPHPGDQVGVVAASGHGATNGESLSSQSPPCLPMG